MRGVLIPETCADFDVAAGGVDVPPDRQAGEDDPGDEDDAGPDRLRPQ